MAINSNTPRNAYTAVANQASYTYTFRIFDEADIQVYVNNVLRTRGTHYTVSGVDNEAGGSITFTTGNIPAANASVVMYREVPVQRSTDFQPNGALRAQSLNEQLDRLTANIQDNQEINNASVIRFSQSSQGLPLDPINSTVASRANHILSFNSQGQPVVSQEIGVWQGTWAANTSYNERDIVKNAEGTVYICISDHTSGSTFAVGTNWAVLIDAVELRNLGVNQALASNNNWTGNQTLTNITETQVSISSNTTPNLANGSVFVVTAAATVTMPAAAMGKSFTVIVNTGTHVTWAGSPRWSRGTEPAKSSGVDIYSFWSDGTNWYGGQAGTNFATA